MLIKQTIQGLQVDVVAERPLNQMAGLPLCFIHGAGMDSSIWEAQTSYFARRHPIYGINLPGHGGSDGSGEDRIDLYAQRVCSVLDELLPNDPFLLVGHSMGGAVAMEMATRTSPSIAGIVLIGTAAKLKVMPIVFETITKHQEHFFKSIAYVAFGPDTRDDLRERLIATTRRCPLPVTVKDLQACNAFDFNDRLPALSLPTLIICGAEDRLVPASLAKDLKERIAESRLAMIPRAGHMPMVEAPDAVNREIEDFLLELAGSGG